MNPHSSAPNKPQRISRLIGWSLLFGGLILSLLASSLSGLGALSKTLQEHGFPAGTLCIAGFLLLTLRSTRQREDEQQSSVAKVPVNVQASDDPSEPGNSGLLKLENRLVAELDRTHESIREDLQEISALLQANLESEALGAIELPLAAGAELTSHQLRPEPRRLGPRPHRTTPPIKEDEEMEIVVEMEEPSADESRLWSHTMDLSEPGDLEDRLTGDVTVDHDSYVWDFPVPQDDGTIEESEDLTQQTSDGSPSENEDDPKIDLDSIGWFDSDEDDLV